MIPNNVQAMRNNKIRVGAMLTILLSVFLTLLIETMQLVMKCGTFEVDDIINNIIGAALGMAVYAVTKRLSGKKE